MNITWTTLRKVPTGQRLVAYSVRSGTPWQAAYASFDCPTKSALTTEDSQASNPSVGSSRRSAIETASCRAFMMGPIETGTLGRALIVEFYVALFCAALALGVLPAMSGNIVLIYSVSN